MEISKIPMTVRNVQGWYEKSMVRNVHGTKSPQMVRNVYGTNSLWYEKSGNRTEIVTPPRVNAVVLQLSTYSQIVRRDYKNNKNMNNQFTSHHR